MYLIRFLAILYAIPIIGDCLATVFSGYGALVHTHEAGPIAKWFMLQAIAQGFDPRWGSVAYMAVLLYLIWMAVEALGKQKKRRGSFDLLTLLGFNFVFLLLALAGLRGMSMWLRYDFELFQTIYGFLT